MQLRNLDLHKEKQSLKEEEVRHGSSKQASWAGPDQRQPNPAQHHPHSSLCEPPAAALELPVPLGRGL